MSVNNDFVKLGLIIAGAIFLFMVLNKYQWISNEGYDTLLPPATLPLTGTTAPVTSYATVPTPISPTSAPPLAPVQADPIVPAPALVPPQPVDDGVPSVMGAWKDRPTECYPKDSLTAKDLLPTDKYSKWNAVNPGGTGDLADKNFLSAGYNAGIDTVGNSKKFQSYDIRGNPAPNPQVAVSPWLQSSFGPELSRKTFEIGGSC